MADMDGNHLMLDRDNHDIYKITLKLKSDNRTRDIGQVDIKHRCITMIRRKKDHYMRALKGYGFNWTVVNQRMPFRVDNILVIEHDENGTDYYLIPIDDVKKFGEKKYFVGAGQELQWFVPLRELLNYRTKDISFISPALVGKKS